MAIKGLVGKEGNTLGTPEQPWEKVYTKPIELFDEHLTNSLFDGKPVYERTIWLTLPNVAGTLTQIYSLDDLWNIDTIVDFGGVSKEKTTTRKVPFYYGSSYYIHLAIENNKIVCVQKGYNDVKFHLKIQYTKTTD